MILPLFATLSALGQSWAPLGASWTYKQGDAFFLDTNLMVIEAVGDTIIQDRTARILSITEGRVGCYAHPRYFAESNDSLFYYDSLGVTFQLLFRWDATIGDTWSTPVNWSSDWSPSIFDTLDWQILDTSHINIDGQQLRKLLAQPISRTGNLILQTGWFTERLGSEWAPFAWTHICDGETFLGTRCYEDDDLMWLNPLFPSCELATSISEFARIPSVNISPNPMAHA